MKPPLHPRYELFYPIRPEDAGLMFCSVETGAIFGFVRFGTDSAGQEILATVEATCGTELADFSIKLIAWSDRSAIYERLFYWALYNGFYYAQMGMLGEFLPELAALREEKPPAFTLSDIFLASRDLGPLEHIPEHPTGPGIMDEIWEYINARGREPDQILLLGAMQYVLERYRVLEELDPDKLEALVDQFLESLNT